MAVNISGQVALVTGASRGIGEDIAYALAREGCQLALTALEADELKVVAARCEELGTRVLQQPLDFRGRADVEALVDRTVKELGGLNILVNNAGVYRYGPVERAEVDDWEEMLDVNLRSAMRLTRLSIPHIVQGSAGAAGRGAVIFISSLASLRMFHGGAGYCASKLGIDGFAGAVFEDIGEDGVKVCVIHPGWVNTHMVDWAPFDRTMMIQPAEVAEMVRIVATWPDTSCPREIRLSAQRKPRRIV